jgi:hypothetical protein
MRLSLCKSFLFFGLGFVLAGLSVTSFAGAFAIPYPSGVDATGSTYTFPSGAPLPTSTSFPLPATGVNFENAANQSRYMPVPETAAANMAKYGDAAVPYLLKYGPVGKAAALAILICTNTNFCLNSDGTVTTPPVASNGQTINFVNNRQCYSDGNGTAACDAGFTKGGAWGCDGKASTYGYFCFGASGVPAPAGTVAPPTSTQVTNAQTSADALPSSQYVPAVQAAAQAQMPLPVTIPTPAPSSVTDSPVITTQTDAAGNPVTRTTTQTTYNSNPVTNNTTNITQNDVTTVTNLTNNTTTTTTTNSAPNPDASKPPDPPPDPKFDTVEDVNLPTQNLGSNLTFSSWGDGTCPGDPSVNYLGHGFVIPFHVVCNAAGYIKPIVLLLAAIISGYIVSGVRKAT